MRFKDTEGAECGALVHNGLNLRDFLKFIHRELSNRFDEFVPSNVRETILAVLAQPAVFSKDSRVNQTLQNAISEARVSHVVEARQNVHFLELLWVSGLAGARSRASSIKADIP